MVRALAFMLLGACSLQDFDSLYNGDAGPADTGVDAETFRICRDGDGDTFGDPDDCLESIVDVDGYVRNEGDCDDARAVVNPLADELCSTSFDDDCDMDANDPDAVGATLWYADEDGDGVGAMDAASMSACTLPAGFSATNTDCDDTNDTVFPAAPELCNGRDDTCEGDIDEGLTVVLEEDDLQAAIDAATTSALLCVAGDHTGPFTLDKNITISGRGGATATFLSGSSGRVLAQSAGIVEGFTVRNGQAQQGAGVYVPFGSALLRNVIVSRNTAIAPTSQGAGIYVAAGAALSLENVTIRNNTIRAPGRNSAAGVFIAGDARMTNVRVIANRVEVIESGSELYGVGVSVIGAGATLNAENLVVVGNAGTFVHTDGSRQHWGAGLTVQDSGRASVANGVIAGNSQTGGTLAVGVGVLVDGIASGAAVGEGHFVNVINAFNTSDTMGEGNGYYNNVAAIVTVQYGDTFGNTDGSGAASDYLDVTPTDSLSDDPLFRSAELAPEFWSVQLMSDSTCIDAGDPAIMDPDGTRSDMGAFGGPGADLWVD